MSAKSGFRKYYCVCVLILMLEVQIFAAQRHSDCTERRWGELCPTEERLQNVQTESTRKLEALMSNARLEADKFKFDREVNLDESFNDDPTLRDAIENLSTGTRTLETTVNDLQPVVSESTNLGVRADNAMTALERLTKQAEDKITELENRCMRLAYSQTQATNELETECHVNTITGIDCAEIYKKGGNASGIYYIRPPGLRKSTTVYCDMDDKGGGWTVIQKRFDGSVDFDRDWKSYKWGFGHKTCDESGEYWLGNEFVHSLTSVATELKIDLTSDRDVKRHASYKFFKIENEARNYELRVNGYFMDPNGGVGDALDGADKSCGNVSAKVSKTETRHKGMAFTTKDRDNDKKAGNCAGNSRGGWWYNKCLSANLNGKMSSMARVPRLEDGDTDGMVWITWTGCWQNLKKTTMKIRPFGFKNNLDPIYPSKEGIRRRLQNQPRLSVRLRNRKFKHKHNRKG